ncbi:NTP transferase domain-containing protein [bacterium]|nr:NTP transferase domain-containing protein [bacterium]
MTPTAGGSASKDSDKPVAIVMAAGKSTRMKSERPKVLHELCGKPVLGYVLDALTQAGVERKIVIVGYQAELVKETFGKEPGVEFAVQTEQLGTGHAVMMAEPALRNHTGSVIVIAGDQPLIRSRLVADILRRRDETSAHAMIGTAIVPDPFGLGRILRDQNGNFIGVVEQKDASPEQALIKEINFSFYCFDGKELFGAIKRVRPENAQKEYYITDVPGILRADGKRIVAEPLANEVDMFGINHRGHLAQAHRLMQERIIQRHFDNGVTVVDPQSTYIDVRAEIGADTVLHPNTVIRGPVTIGKRCQIGPLAIVDAGVILADDAVVEPFAHARKYG